MKQVVGEVMDEKLKPIEKRLECIDVKLHNHLEHNAFQIGGIMKDLSWLRQITEKPKEGNGEMNASQSADIEWLKWLSKLIVGTLIVNILGIVFFAIQYFLKN